MLHLFFRAMRKLCLLLLLVLFAAHSALGQLETATVSGQVVDANGLSIIGARVKLVDIDRDTAIGTAANSSGLYTFPSVRPGRYRMQITAEGFRTVNVTGLIVNVQDHLEQNFKLGVGSVSESITVEGDASLLDTQSAAVSTVVDRNFAENLPMNGRSFQTLVELTPGIVFGIGNGYDQGQFNINGQRGYSNYWTVDGVSANVGINASSVPGGGAAGALQAFSAQGGTNGLVSVDAMQEFRIQTSTYAPEFGRTPGGQISIVTRSGTNQFRGTLFNYFRNDVLDANDWFVDKAGLTKPEERQNDFGGTLGGPILKNRTFFFFSYEGLRLRQPQVTESTVPSLNTRQNAIPAVAPFLNGFPLPNGPEVLDAQGNPTGEAVFFDSHSDRSTLNAASLRIDHRVNDKFNVFGRYNYSPSDVLSFSGSEASPSKTATQTATIGANWAVSAGLSNDVRFNYSRNGAHSSTYVNPTGGAVMPPLASLLPYPFNLKDSEVSVGIFSISPNAVGAGANSDNVQRQINIVDTGSLQKGSHTVKFGGDYRRLSPTFGHPEYVQNDFFGDVSSAEAGTMCCFSAYISENAHMLFQNLGLFAQDTWRISPRLTMTYGIRWDVDFAPSSTQGPSLAAITSCCNLTTLALAPPGTPVFDTKYANVAPRLGIAYQLSNRNEFATVLRGGFGVFYDLATQEAGSAATFGNYPFGSSEFNAGTFPLPSAQVVPPPVSPATLASGVLFAFDPKLKLPYTLEWNIAAEQAIGPARSLSVSYVGSAGRRLTQSELGPANSSIAFGQLVSNFGTSDYHSLQVQFQQRLSHNLQLLASYAWAHSIDTASASSVGQTSNYYSPEFGAGANRGPSDFDVRNSFSAGFTYNIPTPKMNAVGKAIVRRWSVQSLVQARSALPVNVDDSLASSVVSQGRSIADIRPDRVPGVPLYLYGPQYPGRRALNPAAFTPPPTDPNTGISLRQGNLNRNALRGFGTVQWDFSIHREFPIREMLKLQFRAEMFNVLNHPNFGPPVGDISQPLFGLSTQTLANALSQTGSSLSSLYQIGGPRSLQLALKLMF